MKFEPVVLRTTQEHAEEYKRLTKLSSGDPNMFWKSLDLLVIHQAIINLDRPVKEERKHAAKLILDQIRLKRVIATREQIISLIFEMTQDNLKAVTLADEILGNAGNTQES